MDDARDLPPGPSERIREYGCIENDEDLQRIEKLLKNESIFRR